MDASNIHLLISKIMEGLNKSNNDHKINLYTIHDCFATTPDNMNLINKTVKAVFIDLYFDVNFIENMHDSFVNQNSSYYDIKNEDVYENDILINKQYFYLDDEALEVKKKNKVKIYIPLKPVISNNEEVKRIFIEGIKKSLYFIN